MVYYEWWWRAPIERFRRLIDLDYGARANARDALEDIRAGRVSVTTMAPLPPERRTREGRAGDADRHLRSQG